VRTNVYQNFTSLFFILNQFVISGMTEQVLKKIEDYYKIVTFVRGRLQLLSFNLGKDRMLQ